MDSKATTSNEGADCCSIIILFVLVSGFTVLCVYVFYNPGTPQFTLVEADIHYLNTTSPPFISTSMKFTFVSRNSDKVYSITYGELSGYVSYKNVPITPTIAVLPPFHQEKKSTVTLSPVLGGSPVPVDLETADRLVKDERYGMVELSVTLLGRYRWKAGVIRTLMRRQLIVKCGIRVGLKKGLVGQTPLLGSSSKKCYVY